MSRPVTLSMTASRAVSMMTGMLLPAFRRRRSTSKPFSPGSMMSSSSRSYPPPSAFSRPSRPSKALSTAYPSCLSSSSTNRASFSSSSTSNIFVIRCLPLTGTGERPCPAPPCVLYDGFIPPCFRLRRREFRFQRSCSRSFPRGSPRRRPLYPGPCS